MDPAPPADPAAASAAAAAASRDVAAMLPDSPPRRGAGHRRAQSEILLGGALPDDLAFDADLGVVGEGGGGVGGGGDDEDEEDYDDYEEDGAGGSGSGGGGGGSSSRMFEMFLENGGKLPEQPEPSQPPPQAPARPRHQHSMSMDGSTSLAAAGVGGRAAGADAKKAISDAKLAELALVDPKRAKREADIQQILANRQSAARSKERKMRYIAELERKVHTLQTEATTLSAQLSMLQRDTTGLTSENSDLKMRVQTMEQQVRLQDALNDRLRDEIQQLKIATGQVNTNVGKIGNFGISSFGGNPQSYQRSHMQSLLAAQQLLQLQIHPQHQQQQTPLQSQHLNAVQQHQLLQDALPFPGDPKMKGAASASYAHNVGASDNHAIKTEP